MFSAVCCSVTCVLATMAICISVSSNHTWLLTSLLWAVLCEIHADKKHNCDDGWAPDLRLRSTHLALRYGFLLDRSFHVRQQRADPEQRVHDFGSAGPPNVGRGLPTDARTTAEAKNIRWVGLKQDGLSLRLAGIVRTYGIRLYVGPRDTTPKTVCRPRLFDGAVLERVNVNPAWLKWRCYSCFDVFPLLWQQQHRPV